MVDTVAAWLHDLGLDTGMTPQAARARLDGCRKGYATVALADGRNVRVRPSLVDRVRGVDADGDLLVPLGEPDRPIRHSDGSEYLVALTPCCQAHGKGAASPTGTVCRRCHREVAAKFGDSSTLAVSRLPTPTGQSAHVDDGAVARLVVLARVLRVDPSGLDEVVHEAAAGAGSAVNNTGVEGQVGYLLEQLGQAATEQVLRAAAAPGNPAGTHR